MLQSMGCKELDMMNDRTELKGNLVPLTASQGSADPDS